MRLTEISLEWPEYRLFPYERDLALRETKTVLKPHGNIAVNGAVRLWTQRPERASRLTYFKSARTDSSVIEIEQERLERGAPGKSTARRRQATRYSVHGLHEYKGKFNPQVAKAILNYLGLDRKHVLDPFCGSGTTLIECAHAGASALGCDRNPLAVFIANAKLSALTLPASDLRNATTRVAKLVSAAKVEVDDGDGARAAYLKAWFPPKNLHSIEILRAAIEREKISVRSVLKVIVSDLLRDYSWQEPTDLRIRRRKSEFPEIPLFDEFSRVSDKLCSAIEAAQDVLGHLTPCCRAILANSATVSDCHLATTETFDGAITSPPYATALPYIDTQRLSLVWLGLTSPKELPSLEAQLIGSREFHGERDQYWDKRIDRNTGNLPKEMHALCNMLRSSLTRADGFRRRAVPSLLYRYMVGMRDVFRSVATRLGAGAPFALIVGHNHTILSGKRFDINTPGILGCLAASAGYSVEERVELQAYQRYGLHHKNAIAREELLILRKQ